MSLGTLPLADNCECLCWVVSLAECKLQGHLAGAGQRISIGVDTKVHLLLAVVVCQALETHRVVSSSDQ